MAPNTASDVQVLFVGPDGAANPDNEIVVSASARPAAQPDALNGMPVEYDGLFLVSFAPAQPRPAPFDNRTEKDESAGTSGTAG